jgi:hypothetical protein
MNLEEGIGRFRLVLRDRDPKLTAAFDMVSAAEGIQVLHAGAGAAGERPGGALGRHRAA